MTTETYDSYLEKIEDRLSPERRSHCLGSMMMAVMLARRWGVDENKAVIAGLLHDATKGFPEVRTKKYIESLGEKISREDENFPQIWHAIAASSLLKSEFGVNDEEIKRAILLHPTGDANMSLLDKIIFISDYLEPTRSFKGIRELRNLAYKNLNVALVETMKTKILYITEIRKYPLHPRAQKALKFYLSKEKEHKYVAKP